MGKNLKKSMVLIKKGAEANLYLTEWEGEIVLLKKRIPKKYRVAKLDKNLRDYRTIREVENLFLARKFGVPTPIVLSIDILSNTIIMEYINGQRVKEALEIVDKNKRIRICKQIGHHIGRLHKNNLIHGDLTSSNMIITDEEKIFFIDFGLSFHSNEHEDMGVDIHLLKRALYSSHYKYAEESYEAIKIGYKDKVGEKESDKIFKKASQIERRGRYFINRSF